MTLQNIEEKLVGPNLPVSSVKLFRAVHNPELFLGFANFGRCCGNVATATGSTPEETKLKAIMEAYERSRSSEPPHGVIRASANKLYGKRLAYLSIEDYAPLTDDQRSMNFLSTPNSDRKISWVLGSRWNGEPVYVPLDLVCYNYNSRDRLYFANSSGVAAHTDATEAMKLALAELIERDALMRNWFEKETPRFLGDLSLSEKIKAREKYWMGEGRELVVSQLRSEYGTAILATITGEEWPAFVSGAAARLDGNVEAAIEKAVEEAEANFEAYSSTNRFVLTRENCYSPDLHGLFYCDPDNFEHVKYLATPEAYDEAEVIARDFHELMERLDAVIVWLTNPKDTFKVVRILSKELVPISFGYNMGHYSHSVFAKEKGTEVLSRSEEELALPHYFP
ncbi:YcaO-like family protein [Candidatus Saccharibacteria bacterium]|nr:YcaO-like family protein [Candidatus Saccharibacteria bacterium]